MKRSLKIVSAALLGVAWSGVLFAGDVTYTFDTAPDPLTNPQFTNALIGGSHSYGYGTPNWQLWSSGAGAPVGGNPGGYLSIADATNNGNNTVFVFPDIDNGEPLKGFKMDLDLRAGNGTLGRPADGFSISFARSGDQALIQATNGGFGGFAGGDDLTVAQGTAGSGDVENGTKTGVAIVFDAWQGNYLPDTPPFDGSSTGPNPGHSNDREGIAVRLDDKTVIQLDLQNNRNGVDCVPTPQTTTADNGSGLSCQTGTNSVVTGGVGCSRTYGAQDTSGTFANLVWQPLHVQLVPTTTNTYNLNVTYKGTKVVDYNVPTYNAFNGRLVLAGRTGGNNQNCHVDNIHLVTLPATNAVLLSIQGLLNGFEFVIQDKTNGIYASYLTNVTSAKFDNVEVVSNANTHIAYSTATGDPNGLSIGTYTQAVRLVANSVHTVFLAWQDSLGASSFGTFSFTVPPWWQLPPSAVLPLAAVDQTKPGFLVKAYQTRQFQANQARWNEEMVAGLHGPNIAAASTLGTENGALVWDGPLDFANGPGTTGNGFFTPNDANSLLSVFGFSAYPANTIAGKTVYAYADNTALEFFSYVYFPTSGVYNLVVGSDDGYELTVSGNARDRMGTIVGQLDGNLLPNSAATLSFAAIHPVVVSAPGVYPMRLLWENGGGGAGLEFYTAPSFGVTAVPGVNAFLLNDTNNTASGSALQAFRALAPAQTAPPYVSKAVPVRDARDVLYYQPNVIELSDGTGLTVASGSVTLTNDGVQVSIAVTTPGGGITHIKQTGTPAWTTGTHTNLLTFQDNLGATYTYSWAFTVMGNSGAAVVATADPTNAVNVPVIPLANRVDPGTLSSPGFNVYAYQTLFKQPNVSGTAELHIEGLLGPNLVNVLNAFGTNGFFLNTPADFRFPSGTGTGAGGQWSIDSFAYPDGNSVNPFGFTQIRGSSGAVNIDNCALEISCYLNFPSAGNYLMQFNSDDGFKAASPNSRNLADKLGTELGFADVGRGISGPATVLPNSGTPFMINIPAAGAYPFRVVFENGGGDAALEWSVWVPQADGTVIQTLINDPSAPTPILASMASSVASGPWVSYVNPVPNQQGVPWFAPAVVKITDGPALTTDRLLIDSLSEDGVAQTFTASKVGNVTTVAQQLTAPRVYGRNHTNTLVYHDSSNNKYTNTWFYGVAGSGQGSDNASPGTVAAFGILSIPASLTVPIASLDLTQPGFRIKSYQTAAGNNNSVTFTEQQFEGLQGPNLAVQTGAPNGYFTWTNVVDFTISQLNGNNNSSAEWNYDFAWTNNSPDFYDPIVSPLLGGNVPQSDFGFTYPAAGTTINMANNSLMIGSYLVFQQNGSYIMVVGSDDCFKLTVPYGGNPFNLSGLLVGDCNNGRGSAGAGFGPRGGNTWVPFVVTNAPCAIPFRLLYENGGGGGGVEWNIWQQQSDGSVAYKLVNDPFDPESIKAFQATTNQPPYVAFVSWNLNQVNNNGANGNTISYSTTLPGITLSGNTYQSVGTNNGPVQQDLVFGVANAQTTVNTNAPMSLTFKGIPQPFTLSVSNGILLVTRPANDPQWWPSGGLGPLVFNFQASDGRALSIPLGNVATPFWGTLASGSVTLQDQNSPGIKMRTWAIQDTTGFQGLDNRTYQGEQILAGLYGPNLVNPANYPTNANVGGYWVYAGTNPADTNGGVLNFAFLNSPDGDFRPTAFPEHPWPGIPSLAVANKQNNFAGEFLMYVTFPTNGVYTLGVASDDGFRLIKGWTPPQNGSVVVNSPAALAGAKASGFDSTYASFVLTSNITADVAVAYGPYTASTASPFAPPNEYGSTNWFGSGFSLDGCIINDSVNLNGKVALIFRSPTCGFQQKVAAAQAKGAVGVILVNYPMVYTNGSPSQLPVQPGVNSPTMNIPIISVEWADGLALLAAAQTNAPNVTLTPLDNIVNPPADNNVLGEANFGKGASDVLFPVNVTQAGTYPLRLTWFQGGGGASCELFSVVNGTRILVNDSVNGSPLKAYYALQTAVTPTISIKNNGNGTVTITYTGVLQSETDIKSKTWTDVPGATSPWTIVVPPNSAPDYFRASSGP